MRVVLQVQPEYLADLLLQRRGARRLVRPFVGITSVQGIDLPFVSCEAGLAVIDYQVTRNTHQVSVLLVLVDTDHHDRIGQVRRFVPRIILAGTEHQHIRAAVLIHLQRTCLEYVEYIALEHVVARDQESEPDECPTGDYQQYEEYDYSADDFLFTSQYLLRLSA